MLYILRFDLLDFTKAKSTAVVIKKIADDIN